MKPKLINKSTKKKIEGKCYFCPEKDINLLDYHRVVPGKDGGRYSDFNTLCLCANCHRRCHSGAIEIVGRYSTTAGPGYVVQYIENGEEKWL